MKIRSNEPELIDLGNSYYTLDEYNNFLYQLDRISKYLSPDKKMLNLFLKYEPTSILDIGCGGGNHAIQLAQKFRNAQIVGIDTNEFAINYANNQKQVFQSNDLNNLKFKVVKNPELNEPEKSYDILTASLVMHHLTDQEIIQFLKIAKTIAKKAIIINDLHRSWIPYFSSKLIMPLFFNSRLVCYDSLLSIKKSFKYSDWINYLNESGFSKNQYKISWYWPFRWIVEIKI